MWVPVQILTAPLLILLSANILGKTMKMAQKLPFCVRNPEMPPGSGLQSGPTPVVETTWGENQWMEDLPGSFSLALLTLFTLQL